MIERIHLECSSIHFYEFEEAEDLLPQVMIRSEDEVLEVVMVPLRYGDEDDVIAHLGVACLVFIE